MVSWPNAELVDFCGQKLADRICDEKSKKPVDKTELNVKVCFTPKDTCGTKPGSSDQYLVDNGGVYS